MSNWRHIQLFNAVVLKSVESDFQVLVGIPVIILKKKEH